MSRNIKYLLINNPNCIEPIQLPAVAVTGDGGFTGSVTQGTLHSLSF